MRGKYAAVIICLCLMGVGGLATFAVAQGGQSGQANRQEMLQRSKELNERARKDTRNATDRMRQTLQEKRKGDRGFGKDFMNMQGTYDDSGGNSKGR